MKIYELVPALSLALVVVAALVAARLLPTGTAFVLVRSAPATVAAILGSPTLAGVALVDLPAPGLAVLRGDTSQIRSAFGLAVAWEGGAPCSFER